MTPEKETAEGAGLDAAIAKGSPDMPDAILKVVDKGCGPSSEGNHR